LIANGCGDQFLHQGFQITLGTEFGHVGTHLGTDGTTLCRFGITRGGYLIVLWFRKGDTKQADVIAIGGTTINIRFNDGLFFANQTTEFVPGHIHAMEIHETIVALDIFHTQTNFAIRQCFILLQIRETDFDDPSLQIVGGNFLSLCLGNQRFATNLLGKDRRGN